jgi:Ca2+:H+ antiporter
MLNEPWFLLLLGAFLIGSVLLAVHHAEVIAHRVGEPFGTLVLAISVTIIEVALIVTSMLSQSPGSELVARDTVFSAVMIVANGIVGLCIFLGGLKHKEMAFKVDGNKSAFAVLIALATFSLVMPVFTITTPGPDFSTSQLAFAGIASLVLYGAFLFFQTVTHRHKIIHISTDDFPEEIGHNEVPSNIKTATSLLILLISLCLVVGLAKLLSPAIEAGIAHMGAPKSVLGVAIASLVLLPEGFTAIKAALANRLQNSLNLALGSALASIGLTIPAVAAIAIYFSMPLDLGISNTGIIFLFLTFFIGTLTLGTGRATVLQGVVHLIIFFEFLFLSLVP